MRLPTLAIELLDSINPLEIRQALQCDLMIFTSSNAVAGAHKHLPRNALLHPRRFKLASIGTATTRALQQHSITVDIAPDTSGGSEELIALLQSTRLDSSRIVIVRGGSGRETLCRQLQSAGASVSYLPVYRRYCPNLDMDSVRTLLVTQPPDAISVTSNEGLKNLLCIAPADTHQQLFNTPLIVNSERCSTLARTLGFVSQILVAKPPGDDSQLALAVSLKQG